MRTGSLSLHLWIVVTAEIAVSVVVALAVRLISRRLLARAERTEWRGDDIAVSLLHGFLPWAAIVGGLWAAAETLPLTGVWRTDVGRWLLALTVLAITLAAARVAADGVRAGAMAHSGVAGSATIFVNIARIVVVSVGGLIVLGSLGVSITPLLTALGVGGLAVALALQDTLSNLFAGVHILASRKVQPGDFILLDTGQEGYVVDTNWRNTTIRQLPNNLVIVPNATLAASIVTNYHQPEQESSVVVQVGVSYDSDLAEVERVTIDVGRDVMRSVPGAVPGHEPSVRFHTFADSSINFSVILRASEVTAQYLITHEFIKRLHRRYRADGIEIPFPIRTIVQSPPPVPAPPPPPVPAQAPEGPPRGAPLRPQEASGSGW